MPGSDARKGLLVASPAPKVSSRFEYNGVAYLILAGLGFGMLAPWNIILNA